MPKHQLKPYTYHGPGASVTLDDGTPKGRDITFHDGKTYDLPPENNYVKCLVELGYLKPVETTKKPASKPAKNTKKEAKA